MKVSFPRGDVPVHQQCKWIAAFSKLKLNCVNTHLRAPRPWQWIRTSARQRPPHPGRKRAPAENQKSCPDFQATGWEDLSAGQGSQRVWDGPTAILPAAPRASQPKSVHGHRPTWQPRLQWRHLSTELYAAWGVGRGEGTAYVPYSGHCFANRASRPPLNN